MPNNLGNHSRAIVAQPGDNNDINVQDILQDLMMDFPVHADQVLPEGNHRVEPHDVDGGRPQDLEAKDTHSEPVPHFIYVNPQDTDLDDILKDSMLGFSADAGQALLDDIEMDGFFD